MAVFLQPIYTQTVGSGGAASITFNNIPQTFTDLKIVQSSRATSGGLNSFIRFNGDAANNYSWREIYGNGGSAASDNTTPDGAIRAGWLNPAGYTTNTFTNSELYIPNYAGSNYKQVIIDGVTENNSTTSYSALVAGLWRSTSAITSLTFFGDADLAQYTSVTIYGILRQGV